HVLRTHLDLRRHLSAGSVPSWSFLHKKMLFFAFFWTRCFLQPLNKVLSPEIRQKIEPHGLSRATWSRSCPDTNQRYHLGCSTRRTQELSLGISENGW